jgi:hypothetical protein
MTDHDRLFKELLTTFFAEFVELFLPELDAYLDRDSVQFLDKEVFTDITEGEQYEADIVARARFRTPDAPEAFFLIHLESQSYSQSDFGRRLFRYWARLYEKHGLPAYPIALFSYDAPLRPEPDHFRVDFPDRTVLDFQFRTIQLNRLSWRDYVSQPNPVASALMAKMRIAPIDRSHVKLECLRLLATLRLDRARMKLISGFVDTYLRLNPAEERVFTTALQAEFPQEEEQVMQIVTSWMEEGVVKGIEETVLRALRRRFPDVPEATVEQVRALSADAQGEFVEALFDLTSLSDVDTWLDEHKPA